MISLAMSALSVWAAELEEGWSHTFDRWFRLDAAVPQERIRLLPKVDECEGTLEHFLPFAPFKVHIYRSVQIDSLFHLYRDEGNGLESAKDCRRCRSQPGTEILEYAPRFGQISGCLADESGNERFHRRVGRYVQLGGRLGADNALVRNEEAEDGAAPAGVDLLQSALIILPMPMETKNTDLARLCHFTRTIRLDGRDVGDLSKLSRVERRVVTGHIAQ